MKKKQNLQTELTKEKLADAFWALYEQKPFDQITVREIAEYAGYNRSTFYAYYKDVYDILEQAEQEIFDIFDESALPQDETIDGPVIRESTNFLGEFLSKKRKRLTLLLGENGDSKFGHRLMQRMRDELRSRLSQINGTDDHSFEYVMEYMLNAHIGLMMRWLRNGDDISFEEMVDLAYRLTIYGVMPVLTGNEHLAKDITDYISKWPAK